MKIHPLWPHWNLTIPSQQTVSPSAIRLFSHKQPYGLRLCRLDAEKVAKLIQLDLLGHVIENQDPEGAAEWPHSVLSRTPVAPTP